jgi:hypothetical protein
VAICWTSPYNWHEMSTILHSTSAKNWSKDKSKGLNDKREERFFSLPILSASFKEIYIRGKEN